MSDISGAVKSALKKENVVRQKEPTKVSVWQFDDLWEEGYRFDDRTTSRYLYVSKEFAKNQVEASEFLKAAFRFIPKHQGTSKPLTSGGETIISNVAVIIVE